jgi:hypothetical protein
MARSHSIYVVTRPVPFGDDYNIVAAFTVKHELVTWLKKYEKDYIDGIAIAKLRDNGYEPNQNGPIEAVYCGSEYLNIKDLLE